MPTLYVIATPIGNLEDLTLRALRVLREVGLIAAEDTRTTRKLLRRYDIRAPLVSYYEHNREERIPQLLERLAEVDIALVSDAAPRQYMIRGGSLYKLRSVRGYPWFPCLAPRRLPQL